MADADGAVTAENAAALIEANEKAPNTASDRAIESVDDVEPRSRRPGEGGATPDEDIMKNYGMISC